MRWLIGCGYSLLLISMVGCWEQRPAGGVYSGATQTVDITARNALGSIRITSSGQLEANIEATLTIAFTPDGDIKAKIKEAIAAQSAQDDEEEEIVYEEDAKGIVVEDRDENAVPPSLYVAFPYVSALKLLPLTSKDDDPDSILGEVTKYDKSTHIPLDALDISSSSTFTLTYTFIPTRSFPLRMSVRGMKFNPGGSGIFRTNDGKPPHIAVASGETRNRSTSRLRW